MSRRLALLMIGVLIVLSSVSYAAYNVTILNPINDTTYYTSFVDLNWTSTFNVSWAAYSLDGEANNTDIWHLFSGEYQEYFDSSVYEPPSYPGNDRIYYNYTKPKGIDLAYLQAKHGGYGITNYTIPQTCLDAYTDVLMIQAYSSVYKSQGGTYIASSSGYYCFNGSLWITIHQRTDVEEPGTLSIIYQGIAGASAAYDGDYNTHAVFFDIYPTPKAWYSNATFNMSGGRDEFGKLYEESIIWIENNAYTQNITLTNLSSGQHSLVIYANETTDTMYFSDIVFFNINFYNLSFITEPYDLSNETNPTNEGTSVTFRTIVNQSGNLEYKFTVCKSDGFDGSACTGDTWCTDSSTISGLEASCSISTAGLSESSYNWTTYIYDDYGSISINSSGESPFHVNHKPSAISVELNSSNITLSSIIKCNYTFSDIDSDTENSQEFKWYINGSEVGWTSQTGNSSDIGYDVGDNVSCAIRVTDEHSFASDWNTSEGVVVQDVIYPTIFYIHWADLSGNNITSANLDDTVSANANVTDDNNVSWVKFEIKDPYNATVNYTVYNVYRTPQYKSNIQVNATGLWYLVYVYAEDIYGNAAEENASLELEVVESLEEEAGGGGGGGPSIFERVIIYNATEEQILDVTCGNRVCDTNEGPWNCPEDCPINLDVLISGQLFGQYWFVQLLIFFIAGTIIYTLIKGTKKKKEKKKKGKYVW